MAATINSFFASIRNADYLLRSLGRITASRARSFLVYQSDMPASFADKASSHSTKPASWQVAGYARLLALHPKNLNF